MTFRFKVATLALAVCCSSCTAFVRTNPVAETAAKAVPTGRLLAFQEKQPGSFTIVVTRDAGFMGSGCYIGFEVNGTIAARFNPKETATFYVPMGNPGMAVVPDPNGRGLCSVGGWNPVPEHYVLKLEGANLFRISLGAYRRPRLYPVAH